MKDGLIKAAAACTQVHVGNPAANVCELKKLMHEADAARVNLLVAPELCLTGYSCGDLFYSDMLLEAALNGLSELIAESRTLYPVYVLSLPYRYHCKLYNVAAIVCRGRLLGLVPKIHLPNYAEFYEMRQWSSGMDLAGEAVTVHVAGQTCLFGTNLIFSHESLHNYTFGIEICEDAWAPDTPATGLCMAGALLIANPSASNEVVGKQGYRRTLVTSASARLICGYIYACADASESTQDVVFARHHLIAENGSLLAENPPFGDKHMIVTEIDVNRLAHERHRMTSYDVIPAGSYETIYFAQELIETALTRHIDPNPFVPPVDAQVKERAEAILQIQSYGLVKRVSHVHAKTIVVGISGGLDSALALLVMTRAIDILNRPRTDIVAVTMPCFGTTSRTKGNAVCLCEQLGVTLREIDIKESVQLHMRDIGHDPNVQDVTYENSQARMRTQILMNIANELGGLVIGTGDLSELALGWATYNGDHMSMYGVNSSVPKTLVRYIVRYEAERLGGAAKDTLFDILDTPVSPELLPADSNGQIAQKTEDLVGPYELHDFFLYYYMRCGFKPSKIFRLARYAFGDSYSAETIHKWLTTFLRRFTTQQFKRSCMPDGPKVGSATLSPRGDWRMPSDAEQLNDPDFSLSRKESL